MRTNKCFKRITAITLALSMLCNPLQSLATPDTVANVQEEVLVETPYDEPLSTEIISEVEELRESNVKYFRMKDGTYTAVTYNAPVHYEADDGTFQEIDNSLVAVSGSEEQVYRNKAGLYDVKLPATLTSQTPIELSMGEHRLSWTFSNGSFSQPGLLKNPLEEEMWVGDFAVKEPSVEIPPIEIAPIETPSLDVQTETQEQDVIAEIFEEEPPEIEDSVIEENVSLETVSVEVDETVEEETQET